MYERLVTRILLWALTVALSTADTYWIDQSCRRPDRHFEIAFDDFLSWAGRGSARLRTPFDILQVEYFPRLFTPLYYYDYPQHLMEVESKSHPTSWVINSLLIVFVGQV